MGWSLGYDGNWDRDIGYGVPAICDFPGCTAKIDRGLAFVCGSEPYGGDRGCGLYFCQNHRTFHPKLRASLCPRCEKTGRTPYKPKPDTLEWVIFKLTDKGWSSWRIENSEKVSVMRKRLVDENVAFATRFIVGFVAFATWVKRAISVAFATKIGY